MLLPRMKRPSGALALALLTTVASATIAPSNTSTVNEQYFQGTLPLQNPGNMQQVIAQVIPLTRAGAQWTVEGNLFLTNSSSTASLIDGDIAYISCNPADYSGFIDAQGVFKLAYESAANISGVILYSTATDYCSFSDDDNSMNNFPVLSMTNKTTSATVLDDIDNLALHMKYFVVVQGRGSNSGSGNNDTQANPLGPSPSTAVAMIILYSITGIITALFLVIILTGAIRAHRHPERYGRRNVLGAPRQSRAKGLGRAILETIPIIKFGEREEPSKQADVELGSTSDSRDTDRANSTTAPTTTTTIPPTAETIDKTKQSKVETPGMATQPAPITEHTEGIAAAIAPTSLAANTANAASEGDTLGCTICTEDFEKGQDIRVLPCDHKFHPECVDPWLLNVSGTCPLCRVDLRPTKTNESSNSHGDELAPPLSSEAEAEAEGSHHRRTGLRDILFFRSHPDSSAEERINALRRLREQRRNQSSDNAQGSVDAAAEDASRGDRRSRRISTRLSDVFSGRTRQSRSPSQPDRPTGGAS